MLAIAPTPKQLAFLPQPQLWMTPRRPAPAPAPKARGKARTRWLKRLNVPPRNRRSPHVPHGWEGVRQWIQRAYETGQGECVAGIYFLYLLPQMRPDSVLYSRDWRLELVFLKKGRPHYRLYWRRVLVGVVDIPVEDEMAIASYPKLRTLHSKLAAYLICCGFTRHNTTLVEGLASTPPQTRKKGAKRLF